MKGASCGLLCADTCDPTKVQDDAQMLTSHACAVYVWPAMDVQGMDGSAVTRGLQGLFKPAGTAELQRKNGRKTAVS